jgi:hypothetical protein
MANAFKHVYSTRRTLYVERIIGARSRNTCCRVKEVSYSEFVWPALSSIQRACAVSCGYLWPLWLYRISTSSQERDGYQKNIIGRKMCVLIFFVLLSEKKNQVLERTYEIS